MKITEAQRRRLDENRAELNALWQELGILRSKYLKHEKDLLGQISVKVSQAIRIGEDICRAHGLDPRTREYTVEGDELMETLPGGEKIPAEVS